MSIDLILLLCFSLFFGENLFSELSCEVAPSCFVFSVPLINELIGRKNQYVWNERLFLFLYFKSLSSLFKSPLARSHLTNFFLLFPSRLLAYIHTEVKGGQIELIQQSLTPSRLIVTPFSNGFLRRTLCPSEEFNKLSDCLNSGGVIHPLCELWANTETQWEFFTLSILPLPVKQTFEGFLCCPSVFYHFKTLSSYGWSKL